MGKPWIEEVTNVLGAGRVLTSPSLLLPYACDAYTLEQSLPQAVLMPANTEEVAAISEILHRHRVPFLARGAGTSLSGGAIPLSDAVILHLSRMNKVLSVDHENRIIECQPGVVNAQISHILQQAGYFYAPDPSSQQACTVGGNFRGEFWRPSLLKIRGNGESYAPSRGSVG